MTSVSLRVATLPTVKIRLLGPVEVMDGSRAVPLGGPRLRTLIGALALCAPDVVPRDTLVEGIWDAHPPDGAVKTLRAHVAYLRRRLLAGGFGELVVTQAPGYVLAAPVEHVDAHVFQELVASASATQSAQLRADTLRAALGLWRGDVLAGCPAGEWVRAEVTRLHEVRLNATEDLFAAELTLGRHAGAAAELESMVARYPLRERLWELLMRALYRAGRQGDALRAYRRARSLLVTEIGVEPGAELRRLEATILAGREVPDLPAVVRVEQPVRAPAVRGTVPTPLTRLVGRRAEIAELSSLLVDRRLITLTGVGGCGKTRLAVAVAERFADRFADGVWFVDLAPLAEPDLVAGAVARELERPTDLEGGDTAALVNYLRARQCLLVLDNCEHVVRTCAELVTTLLRCCPGLRVLATSREVLGVLGELAWPVPALSIPPPEPPVGGLAELSRYDSVRLFLDRASVTAVRGFADENAHELAALCARLDGLPLAIELAAARTSVLTVAEITGRLHDPTLLCAARHPDRPHHRAMHTTIAWSYDLLDPLTQDRFRRLAVFPGGFTLAAADAVWPSGPPAIDVLADLVAKSLVVVERTAFGARYRLLETIGRWAAARLADSTNAERDARRRHAGHYLALAEEADRHLRGTDTGGWLARLSADHENLRSALAWFAGDGRDPVGRIRLAVALTQYCQLRGRYGEGRGWLEQALTRVATAPVDLAGRAFKAAACFALLTCDYDEAERLGQRALAAQQGAGDREALAMTLRLLASVARERGNYPKALAVLDRALRSLGAGDTAASMGVRHQIGFTRWLAGDLDGAEEELTVSLRWHEQAGGDPVGVAYELIHLAMVEAYRGRLGVAGRLAGDALARCVELDVKEGIAWAWNAVGLVELRHNRRAAAVSALRASLDVHWTIGDRWRQASVLDALAEAVLTDDPVRAAELSGLASAIRAVLGAPVPERERPDWERTQAVLCRVLPDDELEAAVLRGATLRLPDVLAGLPG